MNEDRRKTEQPNTAEDREAYIRELERREAEASIGAYLDRLCARVKAKELHPELREEMRGHLDELIADKEDAGASTLEAALWAMKQMGDADEIGGTLGQVHRPKFNWKLLVPLGVMVLIGLLTLFSIGSGSWEKYISDTKGMQSVSFSYLPLVYEQLLYVMIGAAAFTIFIFFNYKKLQHYSLILYLITIGLSFLVALKGWTDGVSGTFGYLHLGSWRIEWTMPSLYLFVLSLAGILTSKDWRSRPAYHLTVIVLMVLLMAPILPYLWMNKTMMAFFYFLFVLPLYLKFCRRSQHLWMVFPAAVALVALLWIRVSSFNYWIGRALEWKERWNLLFRAIYAPESVREEPILYLNGKINEILSSVGLWGHGFGSSLSSLPYAYSDFVFTYLIYSFGWIGAAFVLFVILGLAVQLIRSGRQVRDLYGKTLIMLLSTAFIVQTLYAIGASLNLFPVTNLHLPFLSYGSSSILYFALFGLIFGIHRRRDMLPAAPRH
ncbi:FtsW/RodA/SpoVE family cell cycle protein [Saccharibacillus brassicae]|nr:FtsW/RodA/SpoVE family cell cycle protein [Saccharibacillus brassicae]